MVKYNNGLKMSEKPANVQSKPLKDLQNTWRTIAQDQWKSYNKFWLLRGKI